MLLNERKNKATHKNRGEENNVRLGHQFRRGKECSKEKKKQNMVGGMQKINREKYMREKIKFRELREEKTEKIRNAKQKEMQSNIQNSKKAIVTK